MTQEQMTILFREEFDGGVAVCYTIKAGFYNHEEHVRLLNGQPNGCTCKGKKRFNECQHQEELAKIEAAYQSR